MTQLSEEDSMGAENGAETPGETIEERCFSAALICLEGHFTQSPPMGPHTAAKVSSMVSKTLEKTHTLRAAREALSRNVAIWIWLTRIFAAAIPSLTTRSVGPLSSLNDPEKGVTPQESTALIIVNHASIKEDLSTLVKLMHIARNMLVNAEPEVPQDVCAAVHFDQMVYQTIILCVNVTSKGYDGEILDESQRLKLTDITELYKKLLVTSLQQAHNWTAKHDRNKMSFWFDVLFDDDDDAAFAPQEDAVTGDRWGLRPGLSKQQVQHWLDRNSKLCDTARKLLKDYAENHADKPPGNLAPIRPLAWNWLPEGPANPPIDIDDGTEKISPVWKSEETDRFEQDKAYGRVSREIDTWWLRARDPNYDNWTASMPPVEFAQSRAEHCKNSIIHRWTHSHSYHGTHSPLPEGEEDMSDHDHCHHCHECHHHDDEDFDEDDHHHDHDHDHEHTCGHDHDHDHEHEHTCGHDHDHDHDHDHHHHHHHEHEHGLTCGHDHDHECSHDQDLDHDDLEHDPDCIHHHHHHHHHDHIHDENGYSHEYVNEMLDEQDIDDDESYGDGPQMGLLTEVPNILDPKQIEALHMIIKSCILDNAGSGLTRAGENLQKTRCRMLLALECGRSLLREMLVFIAVWDTDVQSLIFQVTAQIVEALHHSALIPYAWNSLRIPKDIISPAQTVLLRFIDYLFRARQNSASTSANGSATSTATATATAAATATATGPVNAQGQESKDNSRDSKVAHFLFSCFRTRIVPECAGLLHLQAQIREDKTDAAEFPVDSWDMERAKDGLLQYLDFLMTIAEIPELRAKLIEWEAIYDLVTLLNGLEAGVAKKPLVEIPKQGPNPEAPSTGNDSMVERPYAANPAAKQQSSTPPPPPPPMQEPAHTFPWRQVKARIFSVIAALLQPPAGQRSPGNADAQNQMIKYNGIVPLLNSCTYDDHNPYAKEHVTICLKWLLDGCEAANKFLRDLVSTGPQPGDLKPPPGGSTVSKLKLDGVGGDVKVHIRSSTAPPVGSAKDGNDVEDLLERAAGLNFASAPATTGHVIEEDFMA